MTAELALTRPEHELTMDVLRAQMEAAKRWVDSGLLPKAIRTPQQALTIMSVGREIGVPPLYAFRNIHIIDGKPTCSAELLMALVRRTYGQSAIRVSQASSESCTVEYREVGWDGVSQLTFTLDDAKKAGLASKDNWRQYPRAMLRSRCVSEAVRMAFPEAIAGLYTVEEMGARVRVNAEGHVELDPEMDAAPVRPVTMLGPTPSVVASPDDVTRWLHAWFGTVKQSSLSSDAARAAYVKQYTLDWPKAKQTDSLRTLFSGMTPDEAADFLSDVRSIVDAERREAIARDVMALDDPDDEEHIHSTRGLAQDRV